ncbi:glycosyltransferase family 25 protein [Chitinophaga vietnamensis]|uniref:hypothetical protein n=1 Tax=Chitinophaga vietnamensis TaxID=2593957 RepID=UPI00191C6EFC|nr:hypothetical protein [Chitinophaga vietnamensis]
MQYPFPIPTYIILNEKKYPGIEAYARNTFADRNEFAVTFCNERESEGWWNTVARILRGLPDDGPELVLIGEGDHLFTADYSPAYLAESINAAKHMDADILIGGASSFDNAIRVAEHLYWVDGFDGFQFIIFFRKFFQPVLAATGGSGDDVNLKAYRPQGRKLLVHPFVSIRRDTIDAGIARNMFEHSAAKVDSINKISNYYRLLSRTPIGLSTEDMEQVCIPTYVINLPERVERREHIRNEFNGRDEFEVTIVPACKHKIGAVGLWQTIRKILEIASAGDDDIIIICEDDHQFTESYSKELFLRNVAEAYSQGAGLLIGGIGHFTQAIPVTTTRYWIDVFWSTQFLVLFRKSFDKILSSEFDDTVTADDFLSEIIDEKMVFFPFISIQKDFGYSDISNRNEIRETPDIFTRCENRLRHTVHIHEKHGFVPET